MVLKYYVLKAGDEEDPHGSLQLHTIKFRR